MSPLFRREECRGLALWFLALCVLASVGCHKGVIYNAGSLPPEFIAPRVSSLRNVDLSRLSRSLGNSNVLNPGDLVEITIATGLEQEQPPQWKGRVARDGSVKVPLVGPVIVAGLEAVHAEQVVRQASIERGVFINPNVSLVVLAAHSNRVRVVGAVVKPGTYSLPAANSDVLAALVAAEGLSDDAGTVIEVQHPPRQVISNAPDGYPQTELAGFRRNQTIPIPARTLRINLEQARLDDGQDYRLEDGSTVMVMKRPKRYFHVIGLVNGADQFEMPEDTEVRLLDAIAMAGNRKLELADKVHVIRQVPGEEKPVVIEVSVREAKKQGNANLRIAPGDVVSVEETPVTFIVGTVREFIRFGFSSSLPLF